MHCICFVFPALVGCYACLNGDFASHTDSLSLPVCLSVCVYFMDNFRYIFALPNQINGKRALCISVYMLLQRLLFKRIYYVVPFTGI